MPKSIEGASLQKVCGGPFKAGDYIVLRHSFGDYPRG